MRGLFGLLAATAIGAGAAPAQTLAGVQMHRKPGDAVGFSAFLPGPLEPDERVCVRVVSANGLYDAENEYRLVGNAVPGSMVEVFYPTDHEAFLKGLKDREVAASISVGPCATRSIQMIVASWQALPADSVTLLVNSFRADTVLVRLNDGPTVRCTPVAIEVRSAYDTECTLALDGRGGRVGLEIFRFVNRQPAPETEIVLLLPGG